MTPLLILLWLLLFPLISAACVWVYSRAGEPDLGTLNQGYAAVYLAGTVILLVIHYV